MIKVGTILYWLTTENDGSPTVEEYHVRTIRGGKITAIWKLKCTWGKRSTKNGDFGWLDPIPAWTRKSWYIGAPLPFKFFTTKRQAILDAIKNTTADDFETTAEWEIFNAKIKRMRY